jgi:hypothetical protein
MARKDKWQIPEIIERDILRPIAELYVVRNVGMFPEGADSVEIDVVANSDRVNGKDIIRISYPIGEAESNDEKIYQDIEITVNPSEDPEAIWRSIMLGDI